MVVLPFLTSLHDPFLKRELRKKKLLYISNLLRGIITNYECMGWGKERVFKKAKRRDAQKAKLKSSEQEQVNF